ncbi:serine hydrolase domain-containing protein [uncultured Microbacterium sp.]|uniref:serine hydrolase domain-containing protein n=1 Tax=uncultured Microbacterium sp. TaxID=191216 RepID=UPI0035C9C31D
MRARPRRHRVVAALSGVVAMIVVLAGCAADARVRVDSPAQVEATLTAETVQQLQDAVTAAMTATGSPGAIVGVWAPWSGTWVTALGTQTPAGSDAVSVDAQFRAGTVTRAMTCDVLYRLAAAGTMGLDDSVTKWVSGVPDLKDVTLRQLCDGTSGIGSSSAVLMGELLANPSRVWNPREFASFGLGQARTTQPGAAWRDSDAGYLLLGLALERASGQSAAELLQEDVFGPLGMDASSLPDSAPDSASATVLKGYYSQRGGDGVVNCAAPLDITALSPSSAFTDSGAVTDIQDLGHYARALAQGSLLPAGTDRLATATPPADGAPSWFTTGGGVYKAGSLIGQYGAVPGYLTAAFSDPDSGLTVAVVLNNSAAGPGFASALSWELAAIASKAPPAAGQTAPDAGLPWTPEQYRDLITAGAMCAPAQ